MRNSHRSASAAFVRFAQFHANALQTVDTAVLVAQNFHRIAQVLELHALFLGVVYFFQTCRHLCLRTTVYNVHMFCTHTQCTSGCVHCHVAAADNCHSLRLNDRCRILRIVAVHQVDTCQILIGRTYAHQTFAGDIHEAGQTCTGTDKDRIIAGFHQFIDRQDLADDHIRLNVYAGIFQRLDLLLYDRLRQTDSYLIAQPCQISGTGQTSRTAADNGNPLTVGFCCFLLAGIAMLSGVVCHKAFQTTDCNRFALLAADALTLALILLRTDTAADCRQTVRGTDNIISL